MQKLTAAEKKEEARLEEAGQELVRKETIEKQRNEEARIASLEKALERQAYLNDLLDTLKLEGINSIGDLENKLARANEDVEEVS